tara:strand:+ start:811 stop:1746 length:936 start_codon:yes stop_codon:yes gene_type:complete
MGWLRKKAKQIAKVFRKVGRKLKKGLGKVAKAFGKLGPLGSIGLSVLLPGLGDMLGTWFKGLDNTGFLKQFVGKITDVYGAVKDKVGFVFNKVTDAVEFGLNKLSTPFGGTTGTNLRNFVSDMTNGFVEKSSTTEAVDLTEKVQAGLSNTIEGVTSDVVDSSISKDVKTKVAFKDKPSILETVKDKDLGLKEKITSSREYAAYKPIEATRMAGAAINEGEAAYEAQVNYLKARKSDYFKGQADYQLSAVEQQNYSHVGDMPMFVDYSNFNPDQDPAKQYLSYRGITDYINPVDIGGYGFDYQQFLQSQLTA